jgi:hypothetical protein
MLRFLGFLVFKLVVWCEFEFGVNAHKFELIFCRLQNFHYARVSNRMLGFNRFLKAEDGRDERF